MIPTMMTKNNSAHKAQKPKEGLSTAKTSQTAKPQPKKQPPTTETPLHIFGREVYKADVVKIIGLLVFIAITVGLAVALWPVLSQAFEEGGVDGVVAQVHNAGPWGIFLLLAAQLLQVVVAFIPGEIVQAAAGVLYGPWIGSLVLIAGSALASSVIYLLVSKLGRPFVKRMVSDKYVDKLEDFERSGKMDVMVFILFLIPAMPKDVMTYIVPLTDMRLSSFLAITTVARTPGILLTTYAASGFIDGNFFIVALIVGIMLILCVFVVIFRDNIISLASGNGVGDLRASVKSFGGLRNSAKAIRAHQKKQCKARKENRKSK